MPSSDGNYHEKDDHENCYNLVPTGFGKIECMCYRGYEGYEDKKNFHKEKAEYSSEIIQEINDYELALISETKNLLRRLLSGSFD